MTMTEAQWLASTDPREMLAFLEGKVSERQRRLFACAWWRSIKPHEDHHEVIASTIEEVGTYTYPETGETVGPAWLLRDCSVKDQYKERAAALLRDIAGNPWRRHWRSDQLKNSSQESRVLWVQPVLTWREGTVLRIAQAIEESRDFDRMPILADALQEAGCEDDDVLCHCRGQERCPECGGRSGGEQVYCQRSPNCTGWIALRGPHVRGCHVVDLLLGLA
jgi:hypothetical protein